MTTNKPCCLKQINIGLFFLFFVSNSFAQAKKDTTITYKSEEQIHKELIELALNKSINTISKLNNEFGIKQSIITTQPIASKIGTKEGLKPDDLYVVLEQVYNEKQREKKMQKVGYVRVRSVANNNFNAKGNTRPSTFYKTSLLNIKKGMCLQEIKEKGFTIGLTYNENQTCLQGGYFINLEYITHWLAGLRIGLDIGYNPSVLTKSVDDKTDGIIFKGESFTGVISMKQNINLSLVSVIPQIGFYYTLSPIKSGNDPAFDNLSTDYPGLKTVSLGGMAGVDVGINLNKTLRLKAGYKKVFPLTDPITNYQDFGYLVQYDTQTFSFGIRFIGF